MSYQAKLKNTNQDISEWCRRYLTKNDVFIDVGANDGMISLHAMIDCDPIHVYLVEACPAFDELLPENMGKLAPNSRYSIIRKLALEKVGDAVLYYPEFSPSQSSIYDRFSKNRETVSGVTLPATTIDEIVKEYHIDNPIVMKIDTELSEHLVWKGMSRARPIIRDVIMEFMPSSLETDAKINPEEFLKEIRQDGFEITDIAGAPIADIEILRASKSDIGLHNNKYGYI